ncbi:MAG: hypothetical protein AB2A00_04480 [Myxococcota bacterium]
MSLKGAGNVQATLLNAGRDGENVLRELAELFQSADAAGVRDVLAIANTLEPMEQELLARGVVDLVEQVCGG